MPAKGNSRISPAKLALAVRRLRAEKQDLNLIASDPIAIIGMGCRFPGGAGSPEDYWKALHEGRDCVGEIPAGRWKDAAVLEPNILRGGYLNQIEEFDAAYFGISPREALHMDPQQRLLLEVTWEALWDAGMEPASIAGMDAGVFVAIYNSDYARLSFRDTSRMTAHAGTGSAHSVAAGRLSFLLNVHGPNLAIDTACSSSLIATHLGCQSLRMQECGLAIVASSNLKLLSDEVLVFSKWGMLASDGKCKTFDAGADGFVPGEGSGVLILKRLSDALQDGDRVHAVIRGTAVNHDGRSTVLTAPNGPAQEAVLRSALKNAMLEPSEVSYIETHGTGTSLGDPIEIEAIGNVYGTSVADASPCVLGSVKSNLGHLEASAGIAGLIKAVLSLEHEEIPKNLHFDHLNPEISLAGTRLKIATENVAWRRGDHPRVVGVSSFGLGGTNAHILVEEAPLLPLRDASAGGRTIPLPGHVWNRQRFPLPDSSDVVLARPTGLTANRTDAKSVVTLGNVARPAGDALTYELVWHANPLTPIADSSRSGEQWMLIEGQIGSLSALAQSLTGQGAQCKVIRSGDFSSATFPDAPVTGVVYDARSIAATGDSQWEHPEKSAINFIFEFAKYLTASKTRVPRLWIVASSAVAVLPQEDVAPEQAPLWGILRTLALEYPETSPVSIDTGRCDARSSGLPGVEEMLAVELASAGDEPLVSFRNGIRHVPRWIHLGASDKASKKLLIGSPGSLEDLVSDGTVLITGGLGALGLETARWMAANGARSFVLSGRSGGDREPSVVTDLRAQGVDIAIERADVADPNQLAALLEKIRTTRPPLRVVVHAAGIVQDAVLGKESWESYRKTTAAKIQGAWNLDRLTQKDPVRLMIFYSSAASTLGSPGQGSYAAANAFLDAMAHHRASRGQRSLSVNWGAWASAGMAARLSAEQSARWTRHGIKPMEAADALAACKSAIESGRTQVAILDVNWERFSSDRRDARLFTELRGKEEAHPGRGGNSTEADVLQQLHSAPEADRRMILSAHIKVCARRVLGLEDLAAIEDSVPLQDVGLDSLMALELRNELAQSLGLTLPAGLLFDYPSVEQLSRHLQGLLAQSAKDDGAQNRPAVGIDAMSDEEAERLLIQELDRSEKEKANV